LSVIATQCCGYGGAPASSVAVHVIPSIVGLPSLDSIASLSSPASEPLLDPVKLEPSPGGIPPLALPDPLEPLDEPLGTNESSVPPPASSGAKLDGDVAHPPATKSPTAAKHESANNV
jgi:hypothetical protein